MQVLAVRFEGTIATRVESEDGAAHSDWVVREDTLAALELLKEHLDIVVLSVTAGTSVGLLSLIQWLQDNGVPYNDVWSGFCLPPHDLLLDESALDLKGLMEAV